MTSSVPERDATRPSADRTQSADAAPGRSPTARPRRRAFEVGVLAGGVAAAMLVMEQVKQWVHPDISAWESHLVTVACSAVAVGVAGYAVLRRRDLLHDRLVADAVERRLAAEEVARANALLLATLESNRDGVLVAGLDGAIMTFNRQFLAMWDLPEAVLRGPTRQLMQHAKERLLVPERLSANVARLQTDTESENFDLLELKDGRAIELFTAPQRLDGVVVGRVWRCHDVTAHRQASQRIQTLAHTLRSVSEIIAVTDLAERITFVNPAFLETFGFQEAEVLGRPIEIVLSSNTPEDVMRTIIRASRLGGWRGEVGSRKKDGTDIELFLSTSLVRDESGVPIGMVGVARDITEQKRTEEALARARESEKIVTLAAGIAHEFNNLLQIVLGNAALVIEDLPPDSPTREPLQSVARAGERAAVLTTQLLAYAGRGTMAGVATFNINDEVAERIAIFKALMPPAVMFDVDLASGGAVIEANRKQIREALTSLVTNAAEAMAGRPGRVSVATRIEDLAPSDPRPWVAGIRPAPGRYVTLVVEDQGAGMEAETVRRIFDPFFSTKFLGRGMGLPAVMGIARASGGAIAVETAANQGTRVTVAFPCHQAAA